MRAFKSPHSVARHVLLLLIALLSFQPISALALCLLQISTRSTPQRIGRFGVPRQSPSTRTRTRPYLHLRAAADASSDGWDEAENIDDDNLFDYRNSTRSSRSVSSPLPSRVGQPNKATVYSDDDLLRLLNIHNDLTESVPGFGKLPTIPATSAAAVQGGLDEKLLSLQDVVKQTVQQIENEQQSQQSAFVTDLATVSSPSSLSSVLRFSSHWKAEDWRRQLSQIRGIASDVDGTLLSHNHTLHPVTRQAVQRAVEAALSPLHPLQHFFLATGKTRAGALHSLGPGMATLLRDGAPGVYIQGVYCIGVDGRVVWEQKLSRVAVEQAHTLTRRHGLGLIAYDGDSLYASASSNETYVCDLAEKYGEPRPERLEDLDSYANGFHKLLILAHDPTYLSETVRPELQALADALNCVVTQAIPTMLELLPAGCSKAAGVERLCESLNLDLSTQVCAIGDAENDLEMLQRAAVGVAVGNAASLVQEAADVVVHETNSEGGAGRAIELFGLGDLLNLLEK